MTYGKAPIMNKVPYCTTSGIIPGSITERTGVCCASETCTRKGRGVAFLFTGQGAQYPNMMRGLYESETVFKTELDRCCDLLTDALGLDLRTLILPAAGEEDAASERLALTQYTQPALFCVEYALAQLWLSWGLEPEAMAHPGSMA